MIKNILKISLIGFLIVSCSDADDQVVNLTSTETPIVNDPELVKMGLKITANQNEGNIFESFIFKLEQKNQSFYYGELANHLDSLVFKISDYKRTRKLFINYANGNSGTTQFNHNFYYPGNYNASILGYKNGKIIYKDAIDLKVTDNKDFFVIDWNNFTANLPQSYFNALSNNSLVFYNRYENNNPYVCVMGSWDNYITYTSDQIQEMDKEVLYNFIVKYYQQPIYTENSPIIKDVYNQNFKKTIQNNIPVCIWMTAKNKIALIKEYSLTYPNQPFTYKIIAEPRN
ncbi:hypothetical protein [Chryseobacterium sp. GP-SGM7]|uniref:hypothetical protein n=1 Tax=Chryseobacterium sp. GP-SGM7 TaxID=3411323 RepID=UPI003B93DE8C